jgi:predicted transcriptional regulator
VVEHLYQREDQMSINALAWAFKVQGISSSAKFVLIALCDAHNGHTGECFPRVKRIAQVTLLGLSTVHKATAELERSGLIRKETVTDEDGRTRGVRYHLACDTPSNLEVPLSNLEGEALSDRGGRLSNREPSKDNRKEGTKNAASRPLDPETELFERGKAVLGPSGGGLIAQLLKAKNGKHASALAAILEASTKQNPREYIGAIIRGRRQAEFASPRYAI